MTHFNIEQLRVAKPCGVGWETMTGDEKKRHCDSCEMSVYNTEAMTAYEINRLITKTDGRICGRIRRRADGTIVTKQCPKGLRDYGKRVSRIAAAAMTAILAAFSFSYGQSNEIKDKKEGLKIEQNEVKTTGIKGTVRDSTGAAIPGSSVTVLQEEGTAYKRTFLADGDGVFVVGNLTEGTYEVSVSNSGFKTIILKNVIVAKDELRFLEVELEPSGDTVVVGIFTDDVNTIDFSKTDISTTIYPPPR